MFDATSLTLAVLGLVTGYFVGWVHVLTSKVITSIPAPLRGLFRALVREAIYAAEMQELDNSERLQYALEYVANKAEKYKVRLDVMLIRGWVEDEYRQYKKEMLTPMKEG